MMELIVKKPKELELKHYRRTSGTLIEDEVTVKTALGGICGSDLGVYLGKISHAVYPVRAGHELVGTIIEAGPTSSYPVGTRVVVMPNTFCRTCEHCLRGNTNICKHKQSIGVTCDGGFVDEFVVSSRFVLPLPDDLEDKKAVLIEPFAVVVHALRRST